MANQYTKLFINNQAVDLKEAVELPLNITKRVNDIEGQVQGDFSRASLTIPATKKNINILDIGRAFFNFRIEVDGSPSFDGFGQVRKGKTKPSKYGAIELDFQVNLRSSNSTWFEQLGDTFLSSLTTEVQFFSSIPIQIGLLGNNPANNWAFCFIKFKEWANTAFGGTHAAPSLFETTPALYIKPLIVEAFRTIGYTINSNFFNSDLFTKLILPTPIGKKLPKVYNDEYLNTEVSLSAPYNLTGALTFVPFDIIDVAAPQNPTAFDNVTNFDYTCPLDGYYEVSIALTFAAAVPAPPYFAIVKLQQNGNAVNSLNPIGFAFDDTGASSPYPSPGTVLKATAVVFAQAGDVLGFEMGGTPNVTLDSGTCTFTGEAVLQAGMAIDWKFLLGDLKFLDMFKGIICAYNLSFETNDDTRVVNIEPKDSYIQTNRLAGATVLHEGFYKNTTPKNLSKKVDYNKEGTREFPPMAGRFDFLWAGDSEETVEWVEGDNDFKIYEARYSLSSGADNTKQEKKTVPFFVKSIHVLDIEARYPDTTATPQFVLKYGQNYVLNPTLTEAETDVAPMLLYHAGQRFPLSESDGFIELFEFPGTPYSTPMTFMVNHNDDSGLDPNLGFNNVTLNGVESVGLLQRYYLQELVRKDKGELRKNYVRFNSVDNANFSHRDKAYIDAKKYIVQEIQGFNPLRDAPTNFVFFEDVFPKQSDVDNIQSSEISDVVSLLGT